MSRPKFNKDWANEMSPAEIENMAIRRGNQRATFEAAAVKYCLAAANMEPTILALQRELLELGGHDPQLSFAFMRSRIRFPLSLGVAKLYHIDEITMVDLFKRPTKLQIWRAYHDWRDEEAGDLDEDDGAGGVIFSWPAVAKFMCLHNFPHAVEDGHTRVSFAVNHQTYILEPLGQVLDAVGWSCPQEHQSDDRQADRRDR